MGKAKLATALGLLLAASIPFRPNGPIARAQTQSPASCSGSFTPVPMPGHYTGPWHSDGDYHFAVFSNDLRLQVIIDGMLSVYVSPDGTIAGTATGTLDAPITHDGGYHDPSSGTGTISGALTGRLTAGGAVLTLAHPVIAMKWGTFVGGGYTVDRTITMPNYTFTVSTSDCTTAGGTISETDFPTMQVVADFQGQTTFAPGIGPATGTWSLTSDAAADFANLSGKVDTFIASANSLLASSSGPLTAASVQQQIAAPLAALEAQIAQKPNAARCLLERLAAWEASAAPALLARLPSLGANPSIETVRRAGDLVRAARAVDPDCAPNDAPLAALTSTLLGLVSNAVASGSWDRVALLLREVELLGAPSPQPALNSALHAAIPTASQTGLIGLLRAMYAFGDNSDATALYTRLAVTAVRAHALPATATVTHTKKHHRRSAPTPKPTARPKATAKPKPPVKPKPSPTAKPSATPKPSPTPKPAVKKTLMQVLTGGIADLQAHAGGDNRTIVWKAAPTATRYVVTLVRDGRVLWAWAGTDTSTRVLDTTIPTLPRSADDDPPTLDPSGGAWTVLALDASGTIVGGSFGVAP